MHVTSANIIADTAGEPTEGARTLARRRAMQRVESARVQAEAAAQATQIVDNDTDE